MNRVLLIGENPNGFTGNGLLMKGIANQLIEQKDITFSVFCPCSDFAPDISSSDLIRIIPSDDVKRQDLWGHQKLLTILDTNELDFILFAGIDIWRYADIFTHIKQIQHRKKFKIIHIFPYDLQYLDKDFIQYANLIDIPCVYSQYGFDMLETHVPNIRYFRPSMPQKELFYHYNEEKRQEARSILFPTISPDTFVFGFVGPNQIRKDPQKLIKAFSQVRKMTNKKVVLYMHTNFSDGVFNLQKYAMQCGLDSGDLLVKPEGSFSPFEKMPDIYNAFDCFVNCSMQEGLSYTVIQAMLCGIPIITSYSTAHIELFKQQSGNLVACNSDTYIPIKTMQGQTWIDAYSCDPIDMAQEMAKVVNSHELEKDFALKHMDVIEKWFEGCSDVMDLLKKDPTVVQTSFKEAILFMQHSSAGDVLMTTRCLKRIRNKHGNIPLHYMTQTQYQDILKFNPDVYQILDWNPELRKEYQFVYNPHGEHILRGGFNNLDVKLADMYPYFCKVEPDDFFIYCENVTKKVSFLKTPLNDFKDIVGNKLPYVVVHTTGGEPKYRTYAHMGLVVRGLTLPVIQIGSKTDMYCPSAIDLRNILSFNETAWVMKNASAAIVIDSFPSHLAGAVGTPCIVLYGPAPARVVGPIHDKVPDNLWFDMEPNKLDVCPDMTNCYGRKMNCKSPCINSINPMEIRKNLIFILEQVIK
jgi:glycosyltransferase involved in cell wall biosynthesis